LRRKASVTDMYDDGFCGAAAAVVLKHLAPGYKLPATPFFRAIRTHGDLFTIETNFNLHEADIYHRRLIPDAQPLTESRILIDIFSTGTERRLAASLSAEMGVSPETSDIAQISFSQLLERRNASEAQRVAFQECVLNDGRAISAAVNANHRNFDDVLKVAPAARDLKQWTAGKSHDVGLLKEYVQAISKLDWIDKLPAKALRWFIFTGGGALLGCLPPPIGNIASTAVSAAEFLVDKPARGWKPNQFVEGPLKKFISGG